MFGGGGTNNLNFGGGSTTGFGGFGQTSTTSTFNQANPRTSGSFGQTAATTPGGFGSTWGSTAAPTQQTSAFGAPATPAGPSTGGGIFGSSAATTFGTQGTSAPFGQTAPNTTGSFGTTRPFGLGTSTTTAAPATSAFAGFGVQQPQQQSTTASPFGISATTNTTTPFGSTQPQTTGGFGLQTPQLQQQATTGTGNPPYEPLKEDDTNSTAGRKSRLVYHSINSMPAFRTKSFEELRREDYANGNKGRPANTMQSGFGSTQPQQFGAFGGVSSSTNFGQPQQQATAGGGLFGQQQQQQNAFGAPANSANTAFGGGGSSLFGTGGTQQQSAFGGFGQQQQQPKPAFGFGTTAPGQQQQPFGQQQSAFGSTGQTTSLFGGGATTTAPQSTMFGGGATQQQPQKPAFGFGATNTTFGATAPAAAPGFGGTSLFGNTQQQSSTAPQTSGLFGTNTTQFGAQQQQPQQTGGGGLFSFGNTTNPQQQQQNTTTPNFGAPAATGGGLFGSTFGSTQPSTTGGSLFGATNNTTTTAGGGLFGSTNTAPSQQAGGFLSAPAPAPGGLNFGAGFGNTQQKPGGLFGSTAPTSTNTFGSTGLNFGATGSTAGTTGGLFGAPSLSAPTTNTTSGGLFGTGGGATSGTTTNTGWNTGGGLFGGSTTGGTSLFNTGGASSLGTTGLFSSTQPSQQLQQQQQQQQQQFAGSTAQPNPYGYQEVQRGVLSLEKRGAELESRLRTAVGISQSDALTGPQATTSTAEQQKRPLSSSGSRRSRSIGSAIFQFQASARVAPRSERGLRQVARTAALTPVSLPPPRDRVSERGRLFLEASQDNASHADEIIPAPTPTSLPVQEEDPSTTNGRNEEPTIPTTQETNGPLPETAESVVGPPESEVADPPNLADPSDDEDPLPATSQQDQNSPTPSSVRLSLTPHGVQNGNFINPKAPKLTKLGYITEPPIDILETMTDAELSSVHDFAVSRPGFGKIRWLGAINLTGVDLDRDVRICERDDTPSVEVYDDAAAAKPPHTLNLNREARIVLENVGPSSANPTNRQRALFARRIKKSVDEIGAKLIDYNSDTRVWQFEVKSFV